MNDAVFGGAVQLAGRVEHLHPRCLCLFAGKRLARTAHRGLHLCFAATVALGFFCVGANAFLRRFNIGHYYPFSRNCSYSRQKPILPKGGAFV